MKQYNNCIYEGKATPIAEVVLFTTRVKNETANIKPLNKNHSGTELRKRSRNGMGYLVRS